MIPDTIRTTLTAAERRAVAVAQRAFPVRRCPGGWKGRDGSFITLGLATRLERAGLLARNSNPKVGPFLVATARGRAALGHKEASHV